MSVELIDPYSFDEYFNALISPVSDNTKRQEIPSSQEKQKLMENEKKIKLIQKVEQQNLPSSSMHQNLLMPNMPLGNMIANGVIAIVPLNINHNMLTNNNVTTGNVVQTINNQPTSITKKTIKKRKNLAETSKNIVTTITEVTSKSNDGEIDELGKLQDETDQPPESPNKKTKKNGKTAKKKKETPKRKRVNYCFEIHRSGCQANKNSKLYCKVFLKGKLQSEVDLIKGARGKWAYTFYDQRKKKKERRYWPSQSSGPVIEDPCNCDKCAPNGIQIVPNNNTNMIINGHIESNIEEDYSSPSTEEDEGNLINPQQNQNQMQILRHQQSEYQAVGFPQYDSQTPQVVYYMPHNVIYTYPNEVSQQQESIYQQQHQQHQQQQQQYTIKMEQQKNLVNLKSSNDFQDRNHYLKSSNDFMVNNHQRPWENYFAGSSLGTSNNPEYNNNDGFFGDSLQNNFL